MKNMFKVVFLLLTSTLFAQFAGGTGTQADPYQISTPNQLDYIRNYVGQMYGEMGENLFFLIVNDIDLNGYSWVPVEGWFCADLDGGNHKITGLNIDLPTTDNLGLFKELFDTGKVRNLIIEEGSITGRNHVGAIAAQVSGDGCRIINCHSSCSVSALESAGGLAGINGGIISESSVNAVVESRVNVISYNTQEYDGGSGSGGIASLNTGEINNSVSMGYVYGVEYFGGLTGNNSGTISNSYSRSIVEDKTQSNLELWWIYGSHVGGFAGNNSGSIINSYSTGNVVSGVSISGGFTASGNGCSGCFWDVETSGKSTSAGGIGKTTSEMKTVITYTDEGWDFTGETSNGTNDYWAIFASNNDGYPYLNWQEFGLSSPQSISIDCTLTEPQLSWTAVAGAATYKVYSSANPFAVFPENWTQEVTALTETSWTDPNASGMKKFYVVTGVNSSK